MTVYLYEQQIITIIMKKLILTIAIILGSNLSQAQSQLDTTDLFEGLVYQALKGMPKDSIYEIDGGFNHKSSIGKLKTILEDSGKSFREIFDTMPEKFPGATVFIDGSYQKVKLKNYYEKFIKDHSYDSIKYSIDEPYYTKSNSKVVRVERESIDFYNSSGIRVRFIEITRHFGEIVFVTDNYE
jgi:hypothetical protein